MNSCPAQQGVAACHVGDVLDTDLPCRCGYDLRGLPPGVAFSWSICDSNWIPLSIAYTEQVPVAVITTEIPCTVLLYLYLQRLARIADRPALAGRIRRMMWVAVAMAIAVLPSLMSWFSVAPTVPKASLSLYGFAAFIVCFRAMDLMLELRQALRALDPDAARRRPN